MEDEILQTLIDTYRRNGINLSALINDPLFNDLPIEKRVAAIRKYGDSIRVGSKVNVSDLLKGYGYKAMSVAKDIAPLATLAYAGFRPGGIMYNSDNKVKGAYLTAAAAMLPKTLVDVFSPDKLSEKGDKFLQKYREDASRNNSFAIHPNFSNTSDRDILNILSSNNLRTRRN